jgi:hypothetical protein
MVRNIKLIKNIFILKTICFNQNYNKITFKTFFKIYWNKMILQI